MHANTTLPRLLTGRTLPIDVLAFQSRGCCGRPSVMIASMMRAISILALSVATAGGLSIRWQTASNPLFKPHAWFGEDAFANSRSSGKAHPLQSPRTLLELSSVTTPAGLPETSCVSHVCTIPIPHVQWRGGLGRLIPI